MSEGKRLRLLDGWDARLHAAIEAARAKPFQWGVHDCCLFACDCVLAVTGVDMAAEGPNGSLRGTYDSLQGAVAAMKRICGAKEPVTVEQLVEHFAARHGAREVKPAFARRHAVTLFDEPDLGPALGVCLGGVAAHLRPVEGLVYAPMRLVRRSWMV